MSAQPLAKDFRLVCASWRGSLHACSTRSVDICCLSLASLAARAKGFSMVPPGLSLRRRCGPGPGGGIFSEAFPSPCFPSGGPILTV